MNNHQKGLALALATFIMWGIFPIYFKSIEHVGALQVLSHRIIWSFFLLFLFLYFFKKLKNVKRLLKIKKVTLNLLLTGLLISSNWGIYIYAVNLNHILEASLGYFINPLFSILLGAIFLKEKLNLAAKISIFIVFIAIFVQIYALGRLPFVSLILPFSFALYGLIRKKLSVPSFEGLFIETMLILPFALIFLTYLGLNGMSEFKPNLNGILLFFSGLVTILPLLTFTASTKFLPLSTIGFMQYISPSLSMMVAVFIYGEELSLYKIISFALIWTSLLIVAINGIKHERK
nr:EamA family transporter RarD [Campylobacter sp.]